MSTELLSNFHFMRPLWLVGIIALPIVWLALRKLNSTDGDWNRSIDPKLLNYLTPGKSIDKEGNKNWLPIVLILLSLLALAGPSWERKPMPVAQLQDDMIVILDLSISMLASDVAPNRLIRAKQKLHDLLALRSEGNTSLIVFSGDSHVVTPLTDDINTITSSLSAIDPFIMPVIGSRPDLAIKQAVKLFEQNGSRSGRVIMLADGISQDQIIRISDALASKNISLDILAVGTREGAPIDIPGKGYFKTQGEIVIPQTPLNLLSDLAKLNRGSMLQMSLDDSDLLSLDISGEKRRETKNRNNVENDLRTFDTWVDSGYLLLIILIPLALIAHRQNGLLAILISASFIGYSEPSYSFELADLFKTDDQKAQELMHQHSYKEAATTFKSPEHKAAAHYRAGNFEEANKIYRELNSETALYNRANSLAKGQKLQEALEAYNRVLELNPDHEDALFNKSLVEKLQDQNQQNQDNQNNQDNQESNDQQNEGNKQDKDQQNSNQSSSNDPSDSEEANNGQTEQNQENSDSSDSERKNNEQQKSKQESASNESDELKENEPQDPHNQEATDSDDRQSENPITSSLKELDEEQKQSYEQWMRRIPDDPSGLLRRKFEQQSYERRRKGGVDILNEGEPVW